MLPYNYSDELVNRKRVI